MKSEIISTEHLCLRRYKEEKRFVGYAAPAERCGGQYLFAVVSLRTAEETAKFCRERFLEPYARGEIYHYVICEKNKEEPIGYLHIDGGESHDLGYGLAKEYWNRGYMSEAAAAAVERARQDGLLYLTATHDVNNPRSGSVMRRIGMKYVYSYEELWMPKHFPAIFSDVSAQSGRKRRSGLLEILGRIRRAFLSNSWIKTWKTNLGKLPKRGSCIEKGSAVKSKPAMKKSEFLRRLGSESNRHRQKN